MEQSEATPAPPTGTLCAGVDDGRYVNVCFLRGIFVAWSLRYHYTYESLQKVRQSYEL